MKKDLFELAGLSSSEADCYRLLLENGELSPPEITKAMGISRQSAYVILSSLEKKGIAKRDKRHNKIRYNPEDPEIITLLLTKHIHDLEAHREDAIREMPNLKSIFNLAKNRPGVHIFQGVEGAQKLYEDMLKNKSEELLVIFSKEGKSNYLKTWTQRHFRQERIAKNIGIKEITYIMSEYDSTELSKLLWEKKFLDMPEMPRDMDIFIYHGNVTFIKYNKKEPYGFTIDDELVYLAIKTFFTTIWSI